MFSSLELKPEAKCTTLRQHSLLSPLLILFIKAAHILQPEFLSPRTFKISTSNPSLDSALGCMASNVTAIGSHGGVIPCVENPTAEIPSTDLPTASADPPTASAGHLTAELPTTTNFPTASANPPNASANLPTADPPTASADLHTVSAALLTVDPPNASADLPTTRLCNVEP
jgi:hypothetical protein